MDEADSGGVTSHLLVIVAVGAAIGFLGGLLGKGGSALATPILVAFGVPPVIALAAPLPATVPGTLVAADSYRRKGHIDRNVLTWSLIVGVPATIVGALGSKFIDAHALILVTDVVIVGLGARMFLRPGHDGAELLDEPVERRLIIGVALVTGLAAGLLANSGGFLLAPLFIAVLGMAIKPALGTSLAVAAVLAVPGTIVHLALGHIDPTVVAAFALGSVPLSRFGASVGLRTDPGRLERGYGAVLALLGAGFLIAAFA